MSLPSAPTSSQSPRNPDARNERLVWGAVAVVACFYLLQSLGSLRLEHDSAYYFRIAMSLTGTEPMPAMRFPLGYPAFIAFLDKWGIATSHVIVFSNAAFLAIGLAAMRNIFPTVSRTTYGLIVLLSLLSFPVVRSLVMPLPEAAYFAASMTAVSTMSVASRMRTSSAFAWFAAALFVIAASVALRTIGILLAMSFVWAAWMFWKNRVNDQSAVWGSRVAFASGVTVTIATLFFSDSGSVSRYANYVSPKWAASFNDQFVKQMVVTLTSLGQAGLNLPQPRVGLSDAPFMVAGGLAGIVILLSIRGRRITPAGVYAGSYVLLLFIWPGRDVRLWMPLIPLLIAFVVTAASRAEMNRWVGRAAIAWFALGGLAALGWVTRISVSGREFVRLYNPMTTPGYESRNPTHDADVMRILHHYDPEQAAARIALGQPGMRRK